MGSCHHRCFIELGTLHLYKAQKYLLAFPEPTSLATEDRLPSPVSLPITFRVRTYLKTSHTSLSSPFDFHCSQHFDQYTTYHLHWPPNVHGSRCSSTPSVCVRCLDMNVSTMFGWLHALGLVCANASLLYFGMLLPINRFSILQVFFTRPGLP